MPDRGINGMVPVSMLDPRGAAKGTQSILYEHGLAKTPYGYAKLDLSSGLNSGDTVLGVFPFRELDGYTHVIAVTTSKIYEHDRINAEWDDKTGSGITLQSNITSPISYVEIAHQSSETYYDDDTSKGAVGYHLVVCDGGLSDIQRWAGRYEADFANLTGGEDYHTDASGTTHRALQVGAYKSRIIFISPKDYNAGVWTDNPQRVRWPQSGYLQSFTGTGSGFSDLIDTGGANVWSAPIGNDYIIYQTRGIWNLRYVGGNDVFRPEVFLPDIGLLSYHLITSNNNIHYFVGDDYNIYAYRGGTDIMRIGDPVHKYLQEELNTTYEYRCWLVMGPENKWLWLFIVPAGQIYCTKAYLMNMSTGAWTERDLRNSFGDQEGVTCVNLIGSESYLTGETYTTALATNSPYDATGSGAADATTISDVTERYGDVLYDSTTTQMIDISALDISDGECITEVEFSEGGLFFCFTTRTADPTILLADDTSAFSDWSTYSGMIMRIDDGSQGTNMQYGTHYYTLADICSEQDVAGFSVRAYVLPSDTTGLAVGDASANVPALDETHNAIVIFDPSGETYNDVIQENLVGDRLMIGDATGYVLQFDDTIRTDDGEVIDSRHLTPVFDWGQPDKYKRWPGISFVAEGTASGGIWLRHRTGSFDTSDTGWTDVSIDLTDEFIEDNVWINQTSKRIQFAAMAYSEHLFNLRSLEVLEPEVQDNR
jgi:hypothetical protein